MSGARRLHLGQVLHRPAADRAHAVVARMREYLPAEQMQFLMELSIEPVAAQMAARA